MLYIMAMKDTELEKIIENMKAAGCSYEDAERVRLMHKAGMDKDILQVMKKCRCILIDEMHDSQRRVDMMDRLIRMTETQGGI